MNHRSGDVPLGKKLVDLGFGFEPDARNKIIKYMYSGLCPQGISDKVLWIVAQQRGAQQH